MATWSKSGGFSCWSWKPDELQWGSGQSPLQESPLWTAFFGISESSSVIIPVGFVKRQVVHLIEFSSPIPSSPPKGLVVNGIDLLQMGFTEVRLSSHPANSNLGFAGFGLLGCVSFWGLAGFPLGFPANPTKGGLPRKKEERPRKPRTEQFKPHQGTR